MAFTTHNSILDGIRNDDERAWQRFFAFYAPLIRLAGRDCKVPEMYLDDLVQNVFTAVATGRTASFEFSRGRFIYFLRGVIRNKAREILRSLSRQEKVKTEWLQMTGDFEAPDIFSGDEWLQYIRVRLLYLLKKELPPPLYQIFDLLYIRNWTVARVAQYLEMPQSSVYFARKQIQKKYRTIRQQLRDS